MAYYDVLHLDDDKSLANMTRALFEGQGLSYERIFNGSELRDRLDGEDSYGFFLLDGRFPKEEDGRVEFNAGWAAGLIEEAYPDAKIALYSSSPEAREFCKGKGYVFFDASFLIKDLVPRIRELIKK